MQVFSYQKDYSDFTATYIDSDAPACITGSYKVMREKSRILVNSKKFTAMVLKKLKPVGKLKKSKKISEKILLNFYNSLFASNV